MVVAIIISLLVAVPISYLWVRGIDNMKKNHPDYKGHDFLKWNEKNDGWDDNKNHTEGDF